jgi:hypothetical protein
MTLNLSFMSNHLLDETALNNIKHAQALLLDKIDIPLVDPYIYALGDQQMDHIKLFKYLKLKCHY